MFKAHRRFGLALMFLVILCLIITGCHTWTGSSDKEPVSDNDFTFYSSGADFIKSISDERGSVEITADMRKLFNLYARDYRWFYLPDMHYYESFFEANEYAKTKGYNNFGFAAFYVLNYLQCDDSVSAAAMQQAIQTLFVAKENYEDVPHQVFPRLANYEDGYYSFFPEGGLDHERMFYLLTGLDIEEVDPQVFFIHVRAKKYYFADSGYKPGENEKWLAEKAEKMGVTDLQAAETLIAGGEMDSLNGDYEYETTIFIDLSEDSLFGYNPRFVSSQTRDIR